MIFSYKDGANQINNLSLENYMNRAKGIIIYSFMVIGIFFSILIVIKAIPRFYPAWPYTIIGEDPKTIGFFSLWVEILSAVASFAMVFVTGISVNLNNRQLDELIRQWKEDHTPYLTCHLVTHDRFFRLCITNSSNVVAKDVHISIENFLEEEPLHFDKLKRFLDNQVFLIPPQEKIYFNLLISVFREVENLPKGYLLVSLKNEETDYGVFSLYPSNHAYVIYDNNSSEAEISNKLKDLNKTIKEKKFI